jgi:hypothetical protein
MVAAVLEHGSNAAAAKALNLDRTTFIFRLREAEKRGLIKPVPAKSNPSRFRPVEMIEAQRRNELARIRANMNPVGNVIFRPDNLPFMLIVLGDEHLDNPGTDLDLWKYWISFLDRGKHITGVSMGDMLDNWKRVLSFLYGLSESTEADGYTLVEHYIEQIGEDMDAWVWGNHDSWNGAHYLFEIMIRKYGALQRLHSLRWVYRCPNGREISVKARHKWKGNSMYNEVHGLKRSAMMGEREHVLLGGHKHVSGDAKDKDPKTGFITHCYQVASFKVVDEYADQEDLSDKHMAPGVCLVVDPRLSDNDPDLITHFFDPAKGATYLAQLRREAKKALTHEKARLTD